jgi:hypothetical protein
LHLMVLPREYTTAIALALPCYTTA